MRRRSEAQLADVRNNRRLDERPAVCALRCPEHGDLCAVVGRHSRHPCAVGTIETPAGLVRGHHWSRKA